MMNAIQQIAQRLGAVERWIRKHQAFEASHSTCQVYIKGAQAVATGAPAVVLFDGDEYDPDDLHNTAVNNDRITVIVAGVYAMSGNGVFEANDEGERRLEITVNATSVAGQSVNMVDQTISAYISVARQKELAVGDIVRLAALQTSGGDLDLYPCTLEVTRIS